MLSLVFLALVFGSSHPSGAQATATKPASPPHLTSEQDHQRTMDLLHITSLRRGADGDPKSPNAANYDESKAGPNSKLPDPLLLKNGKPVTTARLWWGQRREEIAEDFNREIYGRVPDKTPKVNWEVVSTTKETNGGIPVITKKMIGHLDNSAFPSLTVGIDLTLTTPAYAGEPVPVMMEFGLSPEVLAMLKQRYPQMMAPGPGPTWQQQVLAKGWGYAEYIPTSVQADNGEGLAQGVIGLANKGEPRKLDDWGALRAWAWGASRTLDYFETDKSVDAKQVGIEGHSRYGKAALVAMANDPRFAIAYISSSGEAGAKLFRRNFGEQIGNIAGTGEYHWMAGNFLKYAGPLTENDLPVDAHELIALCAPRPVFIGAGTLTNGDGWVDAKGMFLAAVGAGPVYKLLGKKDLGTAEFPPVETTLIDGDVAFRQHSGGHTTAPNWPTFLTFAARYLKSTPASSSSNSDLHLTERDVLDDRWAFTTHTTALSYDAVEALAAGNRVLRGYNDKMAEECLQTAVRVWDEEHKQPPALFHSFNTTGSDLPQAEIEAAVELLISTRGGDIYRKRLNELLPVIKDQFAFVGGTAARALPFMDPAFKDALRSALDAYKPKLAEMVSKNPWGVPISLGTWGASGGVTRFATEMYLLHQAFPASIGPQYTLDGLDYVLGRHPVSNVSYVSSVGTQSKLIAYGNNRADYTFVPGGIIPGVVILQTGLSGTEGRMAVPVVRKRICGGRSDVVHCGGERGPRGDKE